MDVINMFKYSDSNKRYYTLDYFYKHKFNSKVFKVSLDMGLTCPNIDDTVGIGGCIYCKNGEVYQYDFETNELCDQFKMGNKGTFISYAMEYMHHTKREIIILHCGDYHIKIFN